VSAGGTATKTVAVGSTAKITASLTSAVDATSYILVFKVPDMSQTIDCPAGTGCILSYHDNSAKSTRVTHQFQAVVQRINPDGTRTDLEVAPETVTVTWVPFVISVTPTPNATSTGTNSMEIDTDPNTSVSLQIGVTPGDAQGFGLFVDGGGAGGNAEYACPQLSSCSVNFAAPGQAATGVYTINVRDSATNTTWASFQVTVKWQTSGGGGGGGGWSITLTAESATEPHYASDTLTATANQTTNNTNYIIKIECQSPCDHANYVYNQCGDSNICNETVPDFSGGVGCSNEGFGTCTYQAFVAVRGDSNPADAVSNVATYTITWASSLKVGRYRLAVRHIAPAAGLPPLVHLLAEYGGLTEQITSPGPVGGAHPGGVSEATAPTWPSQVDTRSLAARGAASASPVDLATFR
jgi:hypothetical protein